MRGHAPDPLEMVVRLMHISLLSENPEYDLHCLIPHLHVYMHVRISTKIRHKNLITFCLIFLQM